LLVDVMNMTPATGSAAGGPVMLTPPAPPGQLFTGRAPSGLPRWFGGAKNGASASVRRASSRASLFLTRQVKETEPWLVRLVHHLYGPVLAAAMREPGNQPYL
jgi:hypothetical protein